MKVRIATALRRLADRLAPAPPKAPTITGNGGDVRLFMDEREIADYASHTLGQFDRDLRRALRAR